MRFAKLVLATGLATAVALPTLTSTAFAAPKAAANSSAKSDAQTSMVAVFNFTSELSESPGDTLSLFGKQKTSLHDLVGRMRKAATDDNVKGIVLLSEGGSMGVAQLEEIQQALALCKKAGKPIFVHSDSMQMRDYALFSCADHIGIVPTADIWLTGIYAEQPYIRGLLDKLGVQPDFLHCGDYKSYSEMYMRTGPSPEADKMENWLLDSIYGTCIDVIAKGRHVDADKVKQWIDGAPYTSETAKAAGLIDAVEHRADFENVIREKLGQDIKFEKAYGEPKQPTMDFSSPFAFFKIWGDLLNGSADKQPDNKPAVAIVYIDGEIDLGASDDSLFSSSSGAHSTDLRKALDQAANDDNIKAVVLRVDSPGGSATASEIILDAAKRVHAKKPVIVSMGDVAGSGGYYVTCASDQIFADRSTITASIGVVGGKMVTTGLWDKVGITFKGYGRGKNAAIMSTSHVWSDDERTVMANYMNDVYGVFKNHVVESRGKKLTKPIDEIAGGRVFTGEQALELGLVDKIGTLQDAIEYTASSAKLPSDYEVRVVPEPKNILEKLMDQSNGDGDPNHVVLHAARALASEFSHRQSLVDLAMPYLQHLDPQRVAKIKAALHTLDLIQSDGVILTTPELMMSR